MSAEPRKRSRFDQTEPDPPRQSRFDRRSRSPARQDSEKKDRSRSPLKDSSSSTSSKLDKTAAAAAAAAAAAKINASLAARKGIQHVDVPPIRTAAPAAPVDTADKDVYQQDGDFIKDIEVNDLRNRYTLTKGATQKQIKDETGADVTTRGSYYPDKSMATAAAPPLYLHVTSTSKEGLEKAVAMIDDLMKQELPDLIDQRRFRRREPEFERDAQGRRKWPEDKVAIDLEPIPGFNLRASVVGAGGVNVKHIVNETQARVQIKGRGSGFMEPDTQQESDEAMYLHITGREQEMVDKAKELCVSLVESIRERYEEFKANGAQGGGGGGGGRDGYHSHSRNGDRDGGYGNGSYGGRSTSGGYGGGSSYGGNAGYGSAYGNTGHGSSYGAAPPTADPQAQTAAAMPAMDAAQMQAWMQYYAANPHEDPYIQYGGYSAYIQQYYQQYMQGYGAAPAEGASQAQDHGQVASSGQQQTYNAVPPPPPPPSGM